MPGPGENFSLKLLIYDLSEGYSKAKKFHHNLIYFQHFIKHLQFLRREITLELLVWVKIILI